MDKEQIEPKEVSSIKEENTLENSLDDILQEIFIYNKSETKINYLPILSKSKNICEKLISIFNKPNTEIKQNIDSYKNFFIKKIHMTIKIIDIIDISYEIMHIIINYLKKNNIELILDIFEIYIEIISSKIFETNDERNKYINELKKIFNYFLLGGFINKIHTDYIYQRLSKFQIDKKLTPKLFNDYLSLIELIYGKEYNNISLKEKLIGKNYIYFYDKENSMIKTNISKNNTIYIKDNCSIILWFYINQEENIIGSKLCQINLIKVKETNPITIDLSFNNDKDIDIFMNSDLLKEKDGKKFEIKKNIWIQLKIQILKNNIKLNMYQNREENIIKNEENKNEINESTNKIIAYDKKIYNYENNLELNDFEITDLNFFIKFIGYIGTIIFCKSDNPSEAPIKSLYGLKSNNISKFIEQTALSDIFFILSPALYIKEKNKLIYKNNNITGEIHFNNLDSLEDEENKKIIDYNNVYRYSKIVDNIYNIGGALNILPLFEIFYKFSKNNNGTEKEVKILENIFIKLFQLIELIIVNKPKNYLDIYFNNNNDFFESIQLFLENISEKFYKNENIITILLNIAKYVYNYCKDNEKFIINNKDKNPFNYFKQILFYPKIILKFSLEQQNKIWNFFESEKIVPKKDSKSNNFSGINLSFCKKCFISFTQLNNFILLFNKKYPNEFLSPDLVNIIKYLFLLSETKDEERESLLLLINDIQDIHKNRISDKIIISITEVFYFYLDFSKSTSHNKISDILKKETKETEEAKLSSPKISVEYFLNSENNFIENLLRILSTNNVQLKKEIINIIKIISHKYTEPLKNYFIKVENEIKKSRKTAKINKVKENEFYHFIEENITPNMNNEIIRDKQRVSDLINQKNKDDDIERRKSSMDSLGLINKSNNDKQRENSINNNLNNKAKLKDNIKKHKSTRSRTPKEKDIDEIKGQFFQKNRENIKIPRKSEFNYYDRISNPLGTNSQSNMVRIYTLNNQINELFTEKEEEKEQEKEKEKIDDKKEELDLIETQKIAMNIFAWLIDCENAKNLSLNKKYSGNTSYSNVIYDKNNIDFNFSDIIIGYLLKLLYTKNLEVINKILLLIIMQKGTNNSDKKNMQPQTENYNKLLFYFSHTKTKFRQFLGELMVNSYLCIYHEDAGSKFTYIKDTMTYSGIDKGKGDYFKEIYEKANELIIDIYFYNNDLNNDIIDEIFDIILDLFGGIKKYEEMSEENIKIKNILMNFLQEFLNSISESINLKLDYYEKNLKNISFGINDKLDQMYIISKEMMKKYIYFSNFIFEYIFLLVNSNHFSSKTFPKNITSPKNFLGFPEFLIYEYDKEGNKALMKINIELYLKIYEKIIDNFNIEKSLEKINTLSLDKKGSSGDLSDKKEKIKKEKFIRPIFYLEPVDINKLLKEYTNNKEYKNSIKEKFILLFSNDKSKYKDIPLILIISILNNYYISTKSEEKIDPEVEGFNFVKFLNSHMKFILTIIIISFLLKENENYNLNKSAKEIQEILFYILLYNINGIIKNLNSESFGKYFIEIFTNIITLISFLWVEDKEHKSLFGLGKNKQKSILKRLLNYYSIKNKKFFDASTFEKLVGQNISKNIEIITSEKENIIESIIKNNIEDKPENIPSLDIFDIKFYEYVYIERKYKIERNLKLLINEGLDKYDISNNEKEKEEEIYKNILNKVDKLKVGYDNNEIYEYCYNINRRKNYRKIKKRLYSWNNSYSDLDVFYKKNKQKNIKFKISNYLSNDMTRKLIVPILDIDYYMPKFQKFKYKENLFRENELKKINQYETIYKTDLKIFDEKDNNISIEKNKFHVFDICYIKSTHHIRGKIFFAKKLIKNTNKYPVSLMEEISSLFFIESNIDNIELLEKKYEDYDSESKTCFISIFKNNKNPKDSDTFLKLDFSDIIFIFIRKYCFRNNSVELFLSNHRSYYFKFYDQEDRDKFLSELFLQLNQNNIKNKIFRSIKSIDENNKTIIIGYYRDEENFKDFSTISNIRELWKNNKISTMEYLMWINIYGNRSFRDSSQYPVFPWLLINHEFKTYEDLLNNIELRNFNYPMGLLCIDEKGKKRQDAYIDTYKLMTMNLLEENLLNIKIKEEEIPEQQTINIRSSVSYNINNNNNSINDILISMINKNLSNNNNLLQDKYIPKLPEYKFDIENLYEDQNYEYEKIPYFFGSHYSNAMYVSHYLMRIFPYCLNMIEIQKKGFDVPERLFINLQNSLYTTISDKGDLREIIPEFFSLPEMFLNINELNLGEVSIGSYIKNKALTEEEKNKIVLLNEVIMPAWSRDNPYIFCEKYRKILESPNLYINPWIDLIFGYTQRGYKAQKAGNVFLPYAYDGVMNLRLTKDMLLSNRIENEFKIRFCEMGVHPMKVFEKKNKITKNKINNHISDISDIISKKQIDFPEIKLKKLNDNNNIISPGKKIVYFNPYLDENDEFFILDNNFYGQKIYIQESKESEKIFYVKDSTIYKEFPIKELINKNIENKLIIKSIFKNKCFIIGGFFDGSLYIVKTPNKLSKKEEQQKIIEKPYIINEEIIIKKFDKSLITSLEIDKTEKYLIYGTQNGSIVIYYLNNNLFKENKNFIEFKKIFKSHNNTPISSISINSVLNIFADCSIDGYVNIYTLSSYNNFRLINSIYIPNPFIPNFVFLSAQPLASIVLYSNDLCKFKVYSLNGYELYNTESDSNLISKKFNEYDIDNEDNMSSPIIFTDTLFNDYLIYIFKKKYVLIREFPSMKIKTPFDPTKENPNEELCELCISEDKKYLYVLEKRNNKIYMINQKFFNNNSKVAK